MIALSTWCRRAHEAPADFVARAVALGAGAIAVDRHLDEATLAAMVDELHRRGDSLPVAAIEAPCPRPKTGRSPSLASADKEERRAAIAATRATIQIGGELGTRVVIVRLGELDLGQDWRGLTREFARGELDGDRVRELATERSQLAAWALDLARAGLDPILDSAANAGMTLALVNQPRWFEIPDAFEILALIGDFQGAPIAPWLDVAADHARSILGFGRARELVAATAVGAWLSDAAGLRGGLPWGQGEVDVDGVHAVLGEDAIRAIHCGPIVEDEEIAAAIVKASARSPEKSETIGPRVAGG